MKVIDLLNKIANGEEVPKKIKIDNDKLLFSEYKNTYIFEDGGDLNLDYYVRNKRLNEEVELIEEDKEIRPLPPYKYEDEVLKIDLSRKIDELIKVANELKKGK